MSTLPIKQGLTALDIADQHHNEDSITVLRRCFIPGVSNFIRKYKNQMIKISYLMPHEIDNMSGEDRNALLVILGLLLTATFQASLSPHGGVWQGDNTSKSKGSYDEMELGTTIVVAAYGFSFSLLTRGFTYCIVSGCWLSLCLCRFCLNWFLIHRV
ncbi:hypothetical protein PVK06_036844 [Gossypium arboreum]|uniref:PGG domain-containing protein n=1 Tax=Gossypium arboreum TaxID=29729 RepID=A0ABR0NKM3_GOSAR|nr:hypothetical protein PVK06_036844 [Gossypium arboreum]